MRGGSQEHGFLAVDFLQFQISGQQISIGDLALLQQFLHGNLRGRIGRGGCVLGGRFEFHHQPVGFRHPLNAGAGPFLAARQIQFHFVLATFDVRENAFRIHFQEIAE